MTIENIQLKPEQVRSMESDFGTSEAVSIFRKLINNHAWVEKCFPVGCVMTFMITMDYANGTPVDPPNPNIWKQCDGSVISDADSPLNGVTLPDLRDKFPKGGTTFGLTGGQLTINLQHNHTGKTKLTTDQQPDYQCQHQAGLNTGTTHYHSLPNAWSPTENIVPKHFCVQAFVRYR